MIYALSTIQIIFIASASLVGAILLFLLIFIPITKLYRRKNYRNYYYRKVYKIALYRDYYLVNNFKFRGEQDTYISVDHILFGEKFIYVIMDKYYDGDLMGNATDPSLILIDRNGSKGYVDNPFFSFNKLMSRFSTETGISTDLMIGVTLINDNCRMNIATDSKQFFMVQRRRFSKLIKLIESRPVTNINAKQLQDAVLAVDKMNKNK